MMMQVMLKGNKEGFLTVILFIINRAMSDLRFPVEVRLIGVMKKEKYKVRI